MKLLLDMNVILDVLLERQPWVADSNRIWEACDAGVLKGYVAAFTLPTIFYISRRAVGAERAREAVRVCLDAFEVCPVERATLELAERLPGKDFEDNLQVACAVHSGLAAIVTRDTIGLANPHIPVLMPADVLASLAK